MGATIPNLGSHLFIVHLFAQIQCVVVARDFTSLFVDQVAYSLVSENNAAQHYPDYTYNHPVFTESMRRYSDSRCRSSSGP